MSPRAGGAESIMMMVSKREDIPLSHVFGTVLMGEVAVLLAVAVMALLFTP